MTKLRRIAYGDLNARQQENYNFQKFAARLADYGFFCQRLSDDWQGADFLACHIDGETILKVQLKGRLSLYRKYLGKDLHIGFFHGDEAFLYPHDTWYRELERQGAPMLNTASWQEQGVYHWPAPPRWAQDWLQAWGL